MRKLDLRVRERIALGILVPAILIEVGTHLKDPLFNWQGSKGGETLLKYLNRFESLRESLPPSGTVGYITERFDERRLKERIPRLTGKPLREWYIDPPTAIAWQNYYLAQYALAPVVLHVGEDFPFVVGNFSDMDAQEIDFQRRDLELVQDFGSGIFLFFRGR